MNNVKIGYFPGVFDLFHIGHLRAIQLAKGHCDYLIVGVLKDGSWKEKETFIPLNERIEIISSCKYVDKVVIAPCDEYKAWELYHFDILFAGEDHKKTKRYIEYESLFPKYDVRIIYLPKNRTTSSTKLRMLIDQRLFHFF